MFHRATGILHIPIDCDAILSIALVIIVKTWKSIRFMPVKALTFIGVHSMNIFMFHTFIYYYYWQSFIYATRNPVVIFATLLIACLLISVLLQHLKHYLSLAMSRATAALKSHPH